MWELLAPLLTEICAPPPWLGWNAALVRNGSNLLIGAAYFSIPLCLIRFMRLRRDVSYIWLALCFAAFITLCGVTHWMHLFVLLRPDYVAESWLLATTALASVTTAAAVYHYLPALVALPSPAMLRTEHKRRLVAEAELRRTLEQRSSRVQEIMVNELNHRVKNTLATVQALAYLSLKNVSRESAADVARFQERLLALSHAHDLLNATAWESADLRTLIERELAAYALGAHERVTISGAAISLPPSEAVCCALMVHELVTNAVKYGSLKPEAPGRLDIGWQVIDGWLHLTWFCGLPVERQPLAEPTRKGFGLRLIRQIATGELAGQVDAVFTPGGLRMDCKFPRRAILQTVSVSNLLPPSSR